jgi:hypothetical protein
VRGLHARLRAYGINGGNPRHDPGFSFRRCS